MVDMFINGRKVLKLAEAARLVGYSCRTLEQYARTGWLLRQRQGKTLYYPLSELVVFSKRQRDKQTKWSQIVTWWQSHPGIQAQVSNWRDFQRRLRRDGIQVSDALVRMFLAKYRPYISLQRRILAWLEADPARRRLGGAKIRKAILRDLHLDIPKSTICRALAKYDARHGELKPPFDISLYQTVEETAEQLGISLQGVRQSAHIGYLQGRVWLHCLYILKASVDEHLVRRQVRLECLAAKEAEARRREMLRSCPWNRIDCQLHRLHGRAHFCPACGHYWDGTYR